MFIARMLDGSKKYDNLWQTGNRADEEALIGPLVKENRNRAMVVLS
jgi:hypothetical protein